MGYCVESLTQGLLRESAQVGHTSSGGLVDEVSALWV